ncbi:hypothetical protein CDAR_474731 [Caerostris darwini]|uniref:Uncharacterized protein n=1 Tax=Caerostris darwini TaxID=1538125 RepID=A0AAV4X0V3_9ARAC|nr:hypothetical protein CDAR_474731 [Caerostris darwini]
MTYQNGVKRRRKRRRPEENRNQERQREAEKVDLEQEKGKRTLRLWPKRFLKVSGRTKEKREEAKKRDGLMVKRPKKRWIETEDWKRN